MVLHSYCLCFSACVEGKGKNLTFHMKRKMKGRDGVSVVEGEDGGSMLCWKTEGNLSRVKALGSNWSLVSGVDGWECQGFALVFSDT